MRKQTELAFVIYFVLLLLLVFSSVSDDNKIVNLVYLVVILSCSLKFVLIVNKDKK